MTQHQEYTFHRGIPIPAPRPAGETPIYDRLVLERALADQEGKDLVKAIHDRNSYSVSMAEERAVVQILKPRPLASLLGGIAGLLR